MKYIMKLKKLIFAALMGFICLNAFTPVLVTHAAAATTQESVDASYKEIEDKVTAPIKFISNLIMSAMVAGGVIVLLKAILDLFPAIQGREMQGIIHGILELIVAACLIFLPLFISAITDKG